MDQQEQNKDVVLQQQAAQIKELEQELRIVRRQLERFQQGDMDEFARQRRAAMQFYREQHEREKDASLYREQHEQEHGASTAFEYECNPLFPRNGLDEIDKA